MKADEYRYLVTSMTAIGAFFSVAGCMKCTEKRLANARK